MTSAIPAPAPMHPGPPFTVVIPAHNEASTIADCLSALQRGAPAGVRPAIIVVPNGCTDRTRQIAAQAAPEAFILELAEGSKPKAINAGLRAATAWPCFVLDADITVDYLSLAATASVLSSADGKFAIASPALRVDLEATDRFVRSYYAVWVTQPYIRHAMVGSGLYGISEQAYNEIGELPDVFGDDEWLRTRFAPERRCSLGSTQAGDPVFFLVRPPRTLLAHIRIEARRMRAVAEIRRRFPSPQTTRNNRMSNLADARASGASYIDIMVYLAMKAASRLLMRFEDFRGKAPVWVRDRAGGRSAGN